MNQQHPRGGHYTPPPTLVVGGIAYIYNPDGEERLPVRILAVRRRTPHARPEYSFYNERLGRIVWLQVSQFRTEKGPN